MTTQSDLKAVIRARQQQTGESYTAARSHVLRRRDALIQDASGGAPAADEPQRIEAAVLKVGAQSARIRIAGESGQVTFRSSDVWRIVPGHWVTLLVNRRWTWRGDDYASGDVEGCRIDLPQLGLAPLPLEGGELEDIREYSEPFRAPDPYAPLWRSLTKTPRPAFEFDGLTWGEFPGDAEDANPTCIAAELMEEGAWAAARDLLMDTLHRDLRCLDAHAHLGSLAFDHDLERATAHYEIGTRIGASLLPEGFEGLLPWGRIYNRPFLRCQHGFALCLWRAGRFPEALKAFERLLSLNPNDNQGARFCWSAVRAGTEWAKFAADDRDGSA